MHKNEERKMEIKREEIPDGDYVLTTNELGIFLKEEGIDPSNLEKTEFDNIIYSSFFGGIMEFLT